MSVDIAKAAALVFVAAGGGVALLLWRPGLVRQPLLAALRPLPGRWVRSRLNLVRPSHRCNRR
jgi:hypothetical protein